jgi:alkylhydroperoxidase family enzyme
MHTREARADGERAALAWTEAVTLVANGHVPDDVYWSLSQQFTEKEMVDVTMAVVAINGWNRLSISFRVLPAEHQVVKRENGRG